mgnify:CR=1 FL=1
MAFLDFLLGGSDEIPRIPKPKIDTKTVADAFNLPRADHVTVKEQLRPQNSREMQQVHGLWGFLGGASDRRAKVLHQNDFPQNDFQNDFSDLNP